MAKKVKAKELPGSGLVRGAGDAIEKRKKENQKMMDSIFGTPKKK